MGGCIIFFNVLSQIIVIVAKAKAKELDGPLKVPWRNSEDEKENRVGV